MMEKILRLQYFHMKGKKKPPQSSTFIDLEILKSGTFSYSMLTAMQMITLLNDKGYFLKLL